MLELAKCVYKLKKRPLCNSIYSRYRCKRLEWTSKLDYRVIRTEHLKQNNSRRGSTTHTSTCVMCRYPVVQICTRQTHLRPAETISLRNCNVIQNYLAFEYYAFNLIKHSYNFIKMQFRIFESETLKPSLPDW